MYNLPKKVIVNKKDIENIEYIADHLSDIYGFCIYSLNTEVKKDQIICTNIKWDISE